MLFVILSGGGASPPQSKDPFILKNSQDLSSRVRAAGEGSVILSGARFGRSRRTCCFAVIPRAQRPKGAESKAPLSARIPGTCHHESAQRARDLLLLPIVILSAGGFTAAVEGPALPSFYVSIGVERSALYILVILSGARFGRSRRTCFCSCLFLATSH